MHRNVKTNISSTFSTLSNKISASTECICNFKIFTSLLYSYKKKKTKNTFKANGIAKISSTLYVSDF